MRAGHSAFDETPLRKPARECASPDARKAGDSDTRIHELMAARQFWAGKIEQAVVILIDKTAMFFARIPVFAGDQEAAPARAARCVP